MTNDYGEKGQMKKALSHDGSGNHKLLPPLTVLSPPLKNNVQCQNKGPRKIIRSGKDGFSPHLFSSLLKTFVTEMENLSSSPVVIYGIPDATEKKLIL